MKHLVKRVFNRDTLAIWVACFLAVCFYFFLSTGDDGAVRQPKKETPHLQDTAHHFSTTPQVPKRTATEKEVVDSTSTVKIQQFVATLKDVNISSNTSVRKKLVDALKGNPAVAREALLKEYNSELPAQTRHIFEDALNEIR